MTSTAIAAQAVPVVVGGVAMATLPDRSPFNSSVQYNGPRDGDDLEQLTAHLQKADCGDPQSQYWVASALRSNFNQQPDWVEIYKWYSLASAQNYPQADAALRGLDEQMAPGDVERARGRAESWQPKTENCPTPA